MADFSKLTDRELRERHLRQLEELVELRAELRTRKLIRGSANKLDSALEEKVGMARTALKTGVVGRG